ncbi:hypothetical protein FH972_026509 [Carpinus fangiana]|uniref:Disease resistance R13L4/SHOC-2-like LRR domain-containing protein n=1 Tax=Carpinus fangiana TaxID=176857 RepID=A0A5N6L4I3_9ROSI|nr:hypothetical protein FH972_026509 [Carpinus fangiana]
MPTAAPPDIAPKRRTTSNTTAAAPLLTPGALRLHPTTPPCLRLSDLASPDPRCPIEPLRVSPPPPPPRRDAVRASFRGSTTRKLSYSSSRSGMPRPASPTKRPQSSYGASSIPGSTLMRRLSTAAPKTASGTNTAAASHRSISPTKQTGRPLTAAHSRARSIAEPRSAVPTPRSVKPSRAPNASADLSKSRLAPTKPSFTAAKNASDPFGQTRDDGKGPLRKKLDDARRDGRLNIAAMDTKCIPPEVMQMYDSEAVQAGSVPWNECVDLVRFLAGDNDIETIGDDIFPDTSIEELQDNGGSNQFGGLETLDLRGNLLVHIPMGLRRLERLTSLNLSRNKLENWCMDVISQIPTLRELNLSDNALSLELPPSIGNLIELESLDLHGNKLSSLPKSIRALKQLRSLNVGNNRISDLNMDIVTLLPLTELYASSNALTGALFPMSVTQMPRLQVLSIANNSIASLSFSPLLSFPSLRRLDVSCNRLFMLPDMSTWQCLNNLLCEENSLEAFPPGFTSLSSLRNASFEHNNIKDLVDGIQDMDSLETLALGGNTIRPTKYMTMSTEQLKMDLAKKIALAQAPVESGQPDSSPPGKSDLEHSGIGETF